MSMNKPDIEQIQRAGATSVGQMPLRMRRAMAWYGERADIPGIGPLQFFCGRFSNHEWPIRASAPILHHMLSSPS